MICIIHHHLTTAHHACHLVRRAALAFEKKHLAAPPIGVTPIGVTPIGVTLTILVARFQSCALLFLQFNSFNASHDA